MNSFVRYILYTAQYNYYILHYIIYIYDYTTCTDRYICTIESMILHVYGLCMCLLLLYLNRYLMIVLWTKRSDYQWVIVCLFILKTSFFHSFLIIFNLFSSFLMFSFSSLLSPVLFSSLSSPLLSSPLSYRCQSVSMVSV